MKFFTSIILIAAGVLLFVFFTKPKLNELKAAQIEVQKLSLARENAKSLETRINQLISVKNSVTAEDLSKMEKMLPNNVENVKLIIDFDKMLQSMVEERGTLRLYKSSDVTDTGIKKISIENPKITPGGLVDTGFDSSRLGVITFSFAVTLTYDDFIEFLRRIEYSTRIQDIESISFSSPTQESLATGQVPVYTFTVTLRTYWLKYIDPNAVTNTK